MSQTTRAILTINAGSSSLRFGLFALGAEGPEVPALATGLAEGLGAGQAAGQGDAQGAGAPAHLRLRGASGVALLDEALPPFATHAQALARVLAWLEHEAPGALGPVRIIGAGHRVVHGGPAHSAPALVDAALLESLSALVPMAPLHQPHNLAAIEALSDSDPALPQVACFDTAFHATQPWEARAVALPAEYEARGVMRYGFHGLSYEYIAQAMAGPLGPRARGRVVVAHLGGGASLCALKDGRSVATTMGFSALDGLVMGTRPGHLDPGVLLWLIGAEGMDGAALTDLLYRRSGLLGVSGISADMRVLLASERPEAARAVALFCYRAARELGSMAAALGGLDALIFTGGIGENAAPVRAEICRQAAWLGVSCAAEANAGHGPRLSPPGAEVEVWVLPTNEDAMIARHAWRLISGQGRG